MGQPVTNVLSDIRALYNALGREGMLNVLRIKPSQLKALCTDPSQDGLPMPPSTWDSLEEIHLFGDSTTILSTNKRGQQKLGTFFQLWIEHFRVSVRAGVVDHTVGGSDIVGIRKTVTAQLERMRTMAAGSDEEMRRRGLGARVGPRVGCIVIYNGNAVRAEHHKEKHKDYEEMMLMARELAAFDRHLLVISHHHDLFTLEEAWAYQMSGMRVIADAVGCATTSGWSMISGMFPFRKGNCTPTHRSRLSR